MLPCFSGKRHILRLPVTIKTISVFHPHLLKIEMLTQKSHKLHRIYTYTSVFKEKKKKKHSAQQTKPDLRS